MSAEPSSSLLPTYSRPACFSSASSAARGPALSPAPATLLLRTAEHGRHPRTCIKAVLGEVLLHKQQRQCVRVRRCHGPPSRRQSPLLHNSACVAGYLQNLQASAVRVLVVPLMRMPM